MSVVLPKIGRVKLRERRPRCGPLREGHAAAGIEKPRMPCPRAGAPAGAIADVGFYKIRRQLQYKAARYGTRIMLADRWYPSSKVCSACGEKRAALGLGERTWTCAACGAHGATRGEPGGDACQARARSARRLGAGRDRWALGRTVSMADSFMAKQLRTPTWFRADARVKLNPTTMSIGKETTADILLQN